MFYLDITEMNPASALSNAVNAARKSDNNYRSTENVEITQEASDTPNFWANFKTQVQGIFSSSPTGNAKTA